MNKWGREKWHKQTPLLTASWSYLLVEFEVSVGHRAGCNRGSFLLELIFSPA